MVNAPALNAESLIKFLLFTGNGFSSGNKAIKLPGGKNG